jgi:hypothetical protein
VIERRRLGAQATHTTIFRHEKLPGRVQSVEISGDAARILALVDGERTVNDIAELLERETPALPRDAVVAAFGSYFQQGLLSWRGR